MAEQFLGSPGTSLVLAVHSVAPPVEGKPSVWSMRTTEGSWRQRSVENVYQQSWLWEQHHRHDRWNEADGNTCGQRASLSACIKTLENTLAALPEGGPFESTRVYLQKEISEKKKESTGSKPLAMRLASCKGAVDRAAAKRAVKMLWNVQYESFNRHSRENENWRKNWPP